MKRKNLTRSALFTSIISLLLCISMLVGTTFAWFTDTVVSKVNTINVGVLDVELWHEDKDTEGYVDDKTVLFNDLTRWEPGVVVYENFKVENKGDLALKYQLALNVSSNSAVIDLLKVAVVKGGFKGDRAAAHALWANGENENVKFYDLATFVLTGVLNEGASTETYGVVIYWEPSENDNQFNLANTNAEALKVDLGISLFATQNVYEEDSFDNKYDEGIEMPEVESEVSTVNAFLSALKNGFTAKLTDDLVLDANGEVPAGVTSAIDLNGYTLTLGKGGIDVEGNLVVTNGNVVSGNGDDDLSFAFAVSGNGVLNINSDAVVDVTGDKAAAVYVNGGDLNVDGTINVSGGPEASAVYIMYSSADVTVNGSINATNGYGINQCDGTTNVVVYGTMSGDSMLGGAGTMNLTYAGAQPSILGDGTATTLNLTAMVNNADELAAAVAAGVTDLYLANGEYNVYGCEGKTLTISGSKNAVLKPMNEGEDGCDYGFGGTGGVGDITFNGVTIDTTANTGSYKGYAYMKGTFNDCNFVGSYSLNNGNDFEFNRCTFDFKNGYFWTWSANSVTFNDCTFNGNSKNILAHGWASSVINIDGCKFAATEKGYASGGTVWTAAVEIDPAGTNTYTINIVNSTINENYAGWIRIKDDSTGHKIQLNGKESVADGLYKGENATYDVANANGLAALNDMMANKTAGKDVVINLTSDIDFSGKTWTPVDSHADTAFTLKEINGNGHTISNLTVNGQAMFTRFAGFGDVTIKDITFDNAAINSTALNTSILTVQSYQNVLLDNVDVKNSAITGSYKVAPLIATVYNESSSTVTATLKNCDVSNTTVNGSLDFMLAGLVAFVYESDNDHVVFENCTVTNVTINAASKGYNAVAAVYCNNGNAAGSFDEAAGVIVTNVTKN